MPNAIVLVSKNASRAVLPAAVKKMSANAGKKGVVGQLRRVGALLGESSLFYLLGEDPTYKEFVMREAETGASNVDNLENKLRCVSDLFTEPKQIKKCLTALSKVVTKDDDPALSQFLDDISSTTNPYSLNADGKTLIAAYLTAVMAAQTEGQNAFYYSREDVARISLLDAVVLDIDPVSGKGTLTKDDIEVLYTCLSDGVKDVAAYSSYPWTEVLMDLTAFIRWTEARAALDTSIYPIYDAQITYDGSAVEPAPAIVPNTQKSYSAIGNGGDGYISELDNDQLSGNAQGTVLF